MPLRFFLLNNVCESNWRVIVLNNFFNSWSDQTCTSSSFCVEAFSNYWPSVLITSLNATHYATITYTIFIFRKLKSAKLLLWSFIHQPKISTSKVIKLFTLSENSYHRPDCLNIFSYFCQINFNDFIILFFIILSC